MPVGLVKLVKLGKPIVVLPLLPCTRYTCARKEETKETLESLLC